MAKLQDLIDEAITAAPPLPKKLDWMQGPVEPVSEVDPIAEAIAAAPPLRQQAAPPPPPPAAPPPQITAREQDWLRGQAASRAPKPVAPNPFAPPKSAAAPEPPAPLAPTIETSPAGKTNAPIPGKIPGMERIGGVAPGVRGPVSPMGEVAAPSLPGDMAGGFVRGAGSAAMSVPRALSRIPGGFRDDLEALRPEPIVPNQDAGFVGAEQRSVEDAINRKRTAAMISRAEDSALPDAPITGAGKVAAALGSTAPYMAAGVLGGNTGTAAMGVLGGIDEAMTRADMSGKPLSDGQRAAIGAGGAAIGSTEALPFARLFSRLKGAGVVAEAADEAQIVKQLFPSLKDYGWSALKQGAEEATQEGLSNVAQDALEASYGGRPTEKIGSEFLENAGTGGAVGVLVDLMTTMAGSRAGRVRMAEAGINPDAFRAWVAQNAAPNPVDSAAETIQEQTTPPPQPAPEAPTQPAPQAAAAPVPPVAPPPVAPPPAQPAADPIQEAIDAAPPLPPEQTTVQQPPAPAPVEQVEPKPGELIGPNTVGARRDSLFPSEEAANSFLYDERIQADDASDFEVRPEGEGWRIYKRSQSSGKYHPWTYFVNGKPVWRNPNPYSTAPTRLEEQAEPSPAATDSRIQNATPAPAAPEPRKEVIQNTPESPAPVEAVDAPEEPNAPLTPQAPASPGPVGSGEKAPGEDIGNGFKQGPTPGQKYRVSQVSASGGAMMLGKRLPGGIIANYYVKKDGSMIDADNVVFNDPDSKAQLWIPSSPEIASQAFSILDEMGRLLLSDPRRTDAQKRLKQLVVDGSTAPAAPESPFGSTPAPEPKANQKVSQSAEPEGPAAVDDVATPTPDPDIFRVPTKSLAVDPVRFQYKVEGIGQGGVNEELKASKKWDPALAGVISVWKDPQDGKTYVVNGHHRFDLASRLNVPELTVRFIDAPDAKEARARGALMNIAEGRGTAIDAAKFMRDTGMSPAQMEERGVSLKGMVAREGSALANLAPSIFDDVVHGNINQKRAVIIGENLPDHADQMGAIAVLRNAESRGKRLTDAEVRELIRRTAQAERKVEQQDTLFGVEEMTQNLALEEAQLSNFVRTKLGNEKKLFSTVGNQSAAERLGAAGNKIDADANKQIAEQAEQALAVYDKLSLSAGPISDALREGARKVANGEKLDTVKESVYTAVRDSVARLLGTGQQANLRAADAGANQQGSGRVQEGSEGGPTATGAGRAGNRVEQTPSGPQETLVTDLEARESQLAAKRDRNTPLAEVPFSLVQEDGPPAPEGPDERQSSMFGEESEETPAYAPRTTAAKRPGSPTPKPKQPSQPASPGSGRMVSRSEIVKELSDMLGGLPIRTGNIAQRGAQGIFKVRQNVIRSKKALDLDTISHEIGHGLHKYLWGTDKSGKKLQVKPLDRFKGELGALDYDPNQKRPFEGFAEYIRLRLTDPTAAKAAAPQFHAWFEQVMSQPDHADMKAVLDDARDRVQSWIQQPGAAKVAASINVTPQKDPISEKIRQSVNEFYFNWVDDKIALKKAVDLFEKLGAKVSAGENAYVLARMLSAANTRAHHTLFEKSVGADNKVNGESLKDILTDVSKRDKSTYNPEFTKLAERDGVVLLNDGMDDFRLYLVAKRASNYAKKGLETGFEKQWIDEAIAATETPEIKDAAGRLYEFQDRVLQYMIDKGAFSADVAERFRKGDEFYVPMYRIMDNRKDKAILGRKMIDNNSPIMKRKGSTREIIDPLESIMRNTYTFMSFADRNDVAQALIKQAEKVQDQGWLVESGIMRPMKRTQFNLEEVRKQIEEVLEAEGIDATDFDFDVMAAIYRPNMDPKRGDNIVRVIVDGEPKLFQMDPSLVEAMDVYDGSSANLIVKGLQGMKNALTFGATAGNPEFTLTNLLRDQVVAGIQSRNGYIPFVDGVFGMFKLFSDKALVEEWMLNGGATSAMMPLTRDNLQRSIQEMTNSRAELVLKHPFELASWAEGMRMLKDGLAYAGTKSEQATRLAEYWRARKKGKDPVAAAFDSRDVTLDFERAGRYARAVNRFIPFFSVALNGADRFVEMMDPANPETRNRAAIAATGLAIASLALWLLNKDDEEWRQVEDWKRDMYWLIPTKAIGLREAFGPFIRIPKPPIWGLLFGSLIERTADGIIKKNPNAFDSFAGSFFGQATPPVMIQAIKPPIEAMTNYNLFTDRPIESAVMQDRSPVNRYTWRTSETAKAMARGFNNIGVEVSPAKIEHMMLGYTAGLGRTAIWLGEEAIGARSDRPSSGPEDRPIFRAFATPESPFVSTDYKNFSKELRRLKQKRGDLKATGEKKYAMRSSEESRLKRLEALGREFSEISGRQYKITRDKNLTRDQKRAEIEKLSKRRDEILRRNRTLYQNAANK